MESQEKILGLQDSSGSIGISERLERSRQFMMIRYGLVTEQDYLQKISSQFEHDVSHFLLNNGLEKVLQFRYQGAYQVSQVIDIDSQQQIKQELMGKGIKTPDFLVLLNSRHLLPIDAKYSYGSEDFVVSSTQIDHNNLQRLLGASESLQQQVLNYKSATNYQSVRGLFILPDNARSKDFIRKQSIKRKTGFYSTAVFNHSTKERFERGENIELCPVNTINFEFIQKGYLQYFENVSGLRGNSKERILLLRTFDVGRNLSDNYPDLNEGSEIFVEVPYEMDEVVQLLSYAILSYAGHESKKFFDAFSWFFENFHDEKNLENIVSHLYDSHYYMYAAIRKLDQILSETLFVSFLNLGINATLGTYINKYDLISGRTLSVPGNLDFQQRWIRKAILQSLWDEYDDKNTTKDNVHEVLNSKVLAASAFVSEQYQKNKKLNISIEELYKILSEK